jgi:hypothetical protein
LLFPNSQQKKRENFQNVFQFEWIYFFIRNWMCFKHQKNLNCDPNFWCVQEVYRNSLRIKVWLKWYCMAFQRTESVCYDYDTSFSYFFLMAANEECNISFMKLLIQNKNNCPPCPRQRHYILVHQLRKWKFSILSP